MKKIIRLITMLLILVLFLALTGCTPKIESTAVKDNSAANITIIGASTAGTLYMVLTAVAECINMSYPGSNVTIIPGSTGANPSRINNNEADVSVTHSVAAFAALKGNPPFSEKMENLATVASLYPSVLQIAVDKATGITSLDEFINNRMKLKFSIGQPGSSSEILFNQILAEYGVTEEDIHAWGGEIIYQNIDSSAQMLADGSVDGAVFSALSPVPHLQEAAIGNDLVLLKINDRILQRIVEQYAYDNVLIPADTYTFLSEDIPSICSYTIIIVPKESPDEVAYKMACAITENIEYLRKVHISLENLTPELLVSNLGVPLHPGAEKYYREKGIIK